MVPIVLLHAQVPLVLEDVGIVAVTEVVLGGVIGAMWKVLGGNDVDDEVGAIVHDEYECGELGSVDVATGLVALGHVGFLAPTGPRFREPAEKSITSVVEAGEGWLTMTSLRKKMFFEVQSEWQLCTVPSYKPLPL